jgi:hypothetical protein
MSLTDRPSTRSAGGDRLVTRCELGSFVTKPAQPSSDPLVLRPECRSGIEPELASSAPGGGIHFSSGGQGKLAMQVATQGVVSLSAKRATVLRYTTERFHSRMTSKFAVPSPNGAPVRQPLTP